jgi:hypothetical protein
VELDPDKVQAVREHGTVGLNRLGNQIWPDEAPIHLPAYDGTMTPHRRAPESPAEGNVPTSSEKSAGDRPDD